MAGDRSSAIGQDQALLGVADPPAVEIINPRGASAFLLIGDHAGNRVPSALDGLGVSAAERARHIGWDIGTAALGRALAVRLDAVFVAQAYSRLVIDCNRDPALADAIPEQSDGTPIPGNRGLDAAERAARAAAIHAPYQQAIAAEIARRGRAGQPTILLSLHSFTPAMGAGATAGVRRPWDVGILHDGANDGFARALLAELAQARGLVVGDNQPYRMDSIDHTVPRHAFAAGLAYAEIEVSQAHLGDPADIARWCDLLAGAVTAVTD